MKMSQSNNIEMKLSNNQKGVQYLINQHPQEILSKDTESNDSICELFKRMAAMRINVDVLKNDDSILSENNPSSQSTSRDASTHEIRVNMDNTLYSHGSKNMASKGSQPSSKEEDYDLCQDSLKQISEIIQSKDVIEGLTGKGEIISQLFEKQLLAKLDASGNINEDLAATAKTTAIKFAKWVEEILNECEQRKKKRNIMQNQQFKKATLNKKEDLTNTMSISMEDNSSEIGTEEGIVKINEISDEDIDKRFGSYLRDATKHVMFHYENLNRLPMIVIHLLMDSNVKIMIVRKFTSNDQWLNWLVEVGSSDSTDKDNTPSSLIDINLVPIKETKFDNEEVQEVLKHSNLEWDANILRSSDYYGKTPILQRQCASTNNDFPVKYPIYHPLFSGQVKDKQFNFEGTEMIFPIPPQQDQ